MTPPCSDVDIRVRSFRSLAALFVCCGLCPAADSAARFGHGLSAFERKDYTAAAAHLRAARPLLPKMEDYIAYYLAASLAEDRRYTEALRELDAMWKLRTPSPLLPKARLLQARVLTDLGSAAEAIRVLTERYSGLPKPEADMAAAEAYAAVGDRAQAAVSYQRVYYLYPTSTAAAAAGAHLKTVRAEMGDAYPPALPRQWLERGNRLMEAKEYKSALAEFVSMVPLLGGADREVAQVRVAASYLLKGESSTAYRHLRSLEPADPEADAERLYYLAECARKLKEQSRMTAFVKRLDEAHAASPWRLKALFAAANHFLLTNRHAEYVPLYQACYESFPEDKIAPQCHWKVTWQSYLTRSADAVRLLREHLKKYPASANASAALYYLGRSSESSGELSEARTCFSRLVERYPNYYYALLARERLLQIGVTKPPARAPDAAARFLGEVPFPPASKPESFDPLPATKLRIERSRLLTAAGYPEWAATELRFGARVDAQRSLSAMELASSAPSPFESLHRMKSLSPDYLSLPVEKAPTRFWELLFPLPYKNDLVRAAAERRLDPYLMAGLIRQESEFNPKAVSRAKALGLTQLRVGTGREMARKAGVARFQPNMLFRPEINLRLGAYYIRLMLDQWNGKWEQVLASYNAGKSRANEWVKWGDFREPSEFVETIPFTETRDYVQAVLRNAALYRRLYGAPPELVAAKTTPGKAAPASGKRAAVKRKR